MSSKYFRFTRFNDHPGIRNCLCPKVFSPSDSLYPANPDLPPTSTDSPRGTKRPLAGTPILHCSPCRTSPLTVFFFSTWVEFWSRLPLGPSQFGFSLVLPPLPQSNLPKMVWNLCFQVWSVPSGPLRKNCPPLCYHSPSARSKS